MSLYRIYAIILRYARVGFREPGRLTQITYFPLLDVLLWGYMGLWIQKSSSNPHMLMIYIGAIILWGTVWTVEMEFSLNLLEEFESHNIVNLTSTPLQLSEWVAGNTILALLKSLFVVLITSGMAYLVFGINILSFGAPFIPILFSIICSGLTLGIFLIGILLWKGQQLSVLIWSIPYLILTFSSPFYALEILPSWIQFLSKALPTTYIFEALRTLINSGALPHKILFASLILNAIYLIAAVSFSSYMFNQSRQKGLAQLEQE